MVKQFHDGMQTRVLDIDVTYEPFPVTNNVKQGCLLATTPTVLSNVLSHVDGCF